MVILQLDLVIKALAGLTTRKGSDVDTDGNSHNRAESQWLDLLTARLVQEHRDLGVRGRRRSAGSDILTRTDPTTRLSVIICTRNSEADR